MTTVVMKSNYFGTPHPRNLPFLPTCPLRLAFSPTHLGVAIHNLRTTPTPNPSWPCEVNPCASESQTRCVWVKKAVKSSSQAKIAVTTHYITFSGFQVWGADSLHGTTSCKRGDGFTHSSKAYLQKAFEIPQGGLSSSTYLLLGFTYWCWYVRIPVDTFRVYL